MALGRPVPRIVGLVSALAAVGIGALLILATLAIVPVAFFVACLVVLTVALALLFVRVWMRSDEPDGAERPADR